jgi:hypothetical protein
MHLVLKKLSALTNVDSKCFLLVEQVFLDMLTISFLACLPLAFLLIVEGNLDLDGSIVFGFENFVVDINHIIL